MNIINKIEQEQLKADVTPFNVGDTIKVHTRVIEGGKERIQIFQGIVIAKRGSGINEAFTVRKISYGEGVERVFPLHTPRIAKIEVVNRHDCEVCQPVIGRIAILLARPAVRRRRVFYFRSIVFPEWERGPQGRQPLQDISPGAIWG